MSEAERRTTTLSSSSKCHPAEPQHVWEEGSVKRGQTGVSTKHIKLAAAASIAALAAASVTVFWRTSQ